LTGTESANRQEFKRLLENAKGGKFQAVLLSEQSHMSREHIVDVMIHWRLLRDGGVRIVTCQRGELDFNNPCGVITAIAVILHVRNWRNRKTELQKPETDVSRLAIFRHLHLGCQRSPRQESLEISHAEFARRGIVYILSVYIDRIA